MVSKQKILIVDDDNNIAELISLYLTKECFDTMIVNDGESVMPAMETFAPNLILLDLTFRFSWASFPKTQLRINSSPTPPPRRHRG